MAILLQFTINGIPTGHLVDPPLVANDIHFAFTKEKETDVVEVQFTKNGTPIKMSNGKSSIKAPKDADDMGIEFTKDRNGRLVIVSIHWTKGGKRTGDPIKAPKGANDVHLKIGGKGTITKAFWTSDGELVEKIKIPKNGANDVHLVDSIYHQLKLNIG